MKYSNIEEDAAKVAVLESIASILREAESLLTVAKNPKNTMDQIAEFATPLIDEVFNLELMLEGTEPTTADEFNEEDHGVAILDLDDSIDTDQEYMERY